jgi:hypothetical protein
LIICLAVGDPVIKRGEVYICLTVVDPVIKMGGVYLCLAVGDPVIISPSPLDNWISNGKTYINTIKPAQICFHSKRPQTSTTMNNNINMVRTITGSMNGSNVFNYCLYFNAKSAISDHSSLVAYFT